MIALSASPALTAESAAVEGDIALVLSSQALTVESGKPYERLTLRVSGPDGAVFERSFTDQAPVLHLADLEAALGELTDGSYLYEVVLTPRLSAADRAALQQSRATGQPLSAAFKAELSGNVSSGGFLVQGGAFVVGGAEEELRGAVPAAGDAVRSGGVSVPVPGGPDFIQVINMDLIVQGSECVGIDCTSGESFGFDTIRLKENNLRIKFEDTSAGTFPSTDWQLTANDSANGGANRFSIEDITAARVPFTITGGAPTNSMFVDSTGRVGFRTSTPVLDLHVATGNTPALRLEQNSSSGFTAQTWDVAGNEANFFIRDVTNGSRLPFRIRPGAPTSSLDIAADGDLGIGTSSPSNSVHVLRSDATARLQVEETNGTVARRVLLGLTNNGTTEMSLLDTSTSVNWTLRTQGNDFFISRIGSGVEEMRINNGGNVTIAGTLTQGSDRNTKRDIVPVNAQEVLARLAGLSISTWNRKTDDPSVRHLGPMAQDFAAAFGLGEDDTSIAVLDMAGVSLAAIQALYEKLGEKESELDRLQEENQSLAERLAQLEALVGSLVEAQDRR
jgi:hypothetical protein